MKTITEILDDPRMERIIAEKLDAMKGNKIWEYLQNRGMLAPTAIIYQYRRQQAQESALPNTVRLNIHIIVRDAIEEVLEMERNEQKYYKK